VSELSLDVEARDDREAARAIDALDALPRLHAAGLYRDALSFDHVDRVAVHVSVKDVHARRVIKSTGVFPPSPVRPPSPVPGSGGPRPAPGKATRHVGSHHQPRRKRSHRRSACGVPRGQGVQGRPIVSRPRYLGPRDHQRDAERTGLAGEAVRVPNHAFITGRQHANEVSSTSHILRLGELLVTDKSYKEILKKVNIVLHPVENPDGAQMAYDLQKLTPTHMLHAGRYSALGQDVASLVGQSDPLLPESLVRTRVWRDWLPDIYLNPHGYPSHEWVQPFAGYVPPGFRTYLSTRGWYTTIGTLRDPRYPNHSQATEAVRPSSGINANPDVRAMDLRHQARYRKWAYGFGPYVFNQEVYKDTAIYYSDPETGEPSGSRRFGAGRGGNPAGESGAGPGGGAAASR
jgi:hypothetical protein